MWPEGPWQRLAADLSSSSIIIHIHFLSLIESLNPSRAPQSPAPHIPNKEKKQKKSKTNNGKSSQPLLLKNSRQNISNYPPGGPGPPSSPSSSSLLSIPCTSSFSFSAWSSTCSSGGTRLVLIHPTLVLFKKVNTASVDSSPHNHLPDGALDASSHEACQYLSTIF